MATVTCEGHLWKKQKIMRSWKEKWFELKGNSLHYFNDESKSVFAGSKTVIAVTLVDGSDVDFDITDQSGKISHMRADSVLERKRWFKALSNAISSRPVESRLASKRSSADSDPNKKNEEWKELLHEFDMLKSIGKGGFGRVILVRKNCGHDADQIYALKILSKELVRRTRQVESTRAEREILLGISHPFIAKLRYAFQNAEKLYMVMDYYSGGSMYFHLCQERHFKPHVVKFWAQELLLALAHLHDNNILYRDMKLENILMDSQGHVAVTDFGLAKMGVFADEAKSVCGTPVYLAPEMLLRQEYGKAVDYWALGTVLYELAVGRAPFQDRVREKMFQKIVYSSVKYPQGLQPEFENLISKLLMKDPLHRLGHGGSDEVKEHQYFTGVKWSSVLNKRMQPPYKPRVSAPGSNVDKNAIGLEARDSTVSGYRNSSFENFTFVQPSMTDNC